MIPAIMALSGTSNNLLHERVQAAPISAGVGSRYTEYSDTLRAPSAIVLIDSLLLKWHLGMMHLYDTLLAYPDLQKLAGVTPLISRDGYCRPGTDSTISMSERVSMAKYPYSEVVGTISRTPSLAGAVRSVRLTPDEFAVATLSIEQQYCAQFNFKQYFASTGHWPVDSSNSTVGTLAKNFAFFWGEHGVEKTGRLQRKNAGWKDVWFNNAKYSHKRRVEDTIGLSSMIDSAGNEVPITY